MITFTEEFEGFWRIVYENGVYIGTALREVDGYLYFWPELTEGGFWASHILRMIADTLDELNEPWDQQVAMMHSLSPINAPNTAGYHHYFVCHSPGLSGTTPITLRQSEEGWIARMGIAIFGSSNMSEEEIKEKCGNNPFHEDFHDNFVEGKGATEFAAVEDMKDNHKELHASLWL